MMATRIRDTAFKRVLKAMPDGAEITINGPIGKLTLMCYNCGCQMSDNDMGEEKNITEKTFEDAAKAMGQSVEEAKKNTLELLQQEVGKKK
jgi:hypothetical protein